MQREVGPNDGVAIARGAVKRKHISRDEKSNSGLQKDAESSLLMQVASKVGSTCKSGTEDDMRMQPEGSQRSCVQLRRPRLRRLRSGLAKNGQKRHVSPLQRGAERNPIVNNASFTIMDKLEIYYNFALGIVLVEAPDMEAKMLRAKP